MAALNFLALDYGASNGRGILGRFDGRSVSLKELHRFENNYCELNGTYYWDVIRLYENAKASFSVAKKQGIELDAFGIDTWGVDYGLLDKNGNLMGNMVSYRNSTEADMEKTWALIPRQQLFKRTGIAHLCFNTIYQLHQRSIKGDATLSAAKTLLFLPDLLGYFLTGEMQTEYTFATTSMLYDPKAQDWAYDIIKKLWLPDDIFTPIQSPGIIRGCLQTSVANELGVLRVPYAVVGEHDTASAVAAIPSKGSFAFCSSGTWSLFGVETDEPVITKEVYEANFSNEGTVQGGFRPLKNIMGLWIIQECRREWLKNNQNLSWDDIANAAKEAAPLCSIIDPDRPEFFAAGDMVCKIQDYCKNTNQPIPETIGEIARCVYESLALKYRWALERLEEIKGSGIDSLNIVGGGIQNKLLNQMVANSIGRPVITGPIEGAAMGNILMQAIALGELRDIAELREVVHNSIDVEYYSPVRNQSWDDAYFKLLKLMENKV